MPNKDTAKIALVLKSKKPALIFIISLLVTGSILFFVAKDSIKYQNVDIGGQNLKLEIADTDELRAKGLSDRPNVEKNGGMLFDFEQTGNWGIWTKDMNFNIDVIWLNQNGQVLCVLQNLSPDTYPQSFYADKPSRYIIELHADSINKLGISEGSTIRLN